MSPCHIPGAVLDADSSLKTVTKEDFVKIINLVMLPQIFHPR